MAFLHPIDDRYFEDYVEGDVHAFGSIAVEADEIIDPHLRRQLEDDSGVLTGEL